MRAVYKFSLGYPSTGAYQIVDLPMHYNICAVHMQNDRLMVWVDHYTETMTYPWEFFIYGTGFEIPPGLDFVGTVFSGTWVWHVYRNKTPNLNLREENQL